MISIIGRIFCFLFFISYIIDCNEGFKEMLPNSPNVCLYLKPRVVMIKIPVVEQVPEYVKILKPNCTFDMLNDTDCFQLKKQTTTSFKFDYINKTIYEKKFDCCPGWSQLRNQTGCTKRSCLKRSCLNGVCDIITMSCKCNPGFQGQQCQYDINECGNNNGNCSQLCQNLYGTYKCQCKHGFELLPDNKTCVDMNECDDPNKNPCQHTCINLYGGYRCECNDTYQLLSDGHSCKKISCNNDELCNNETIVNFESPVEVMNIVKLYIMNSYEQKSCQSGWYGKNCLKKCECKNDSICNQEDGSCNCSIGWKGKYCNETCDSGFYGYNCSLKCNCLKTQKCNSITGDCECEKNDENCASICPEGFYGVNCEKTCKCKNGGLCLKNGDCKCALGYHGKFCDFTCDPGYYGQNCARKCKTCKFNVYCDRVTGRCPNCLMGKNCKTSEND